MTGPGPLAASLNVLFGLSFTNSGEARAWLSGGGWELLDAWVATRPADPDDYTTTTEETSP